VCAKNLGKIYEQKNWWLNNTLRQRLSRLARKTHSFSKKEYMLNLRVKVFAVHSHLECINY
jgi:IS1 family transposase